MTHPPSVNPSSPEPNASSPIPDRFPDAPQPDPGASSPPVNPPSAEPGVSSAPPTQPAPDASPPPGVLAAHRASTAIPAAHRGALRPAAVSAPKPTPERTAFKRAFSTGLGAALGVVAVVATLSIISTLALAGVVTLLSGQDQSPTRVIWGSASAKSTLFAVRIDGTIHASPSEGVAQTDGTYGYEVADLIDRLQASDADGLMLLMNTPGGTINGSRAIAEAINRYRDRTQKKVYAYVEGMSASGGMYAMAGADRISADHGSLIGSIGVTSGPFERYRDVTSAGSITASEITFEYLTQGAGKDFGSPYRDMTQEEKTIWIQTLANEYDLFVDWVSKGRHIPAETIKTKIGAHLYDTRSAVTLKLIDDIMSRPAAFEDAARLSNLDPASTKVVTPSKPGLLSSTLGAERRVPGSAPAAQPVGGQPAKVTSVICTGPPIVLAFHGNPRSVCG